jgi:hypothetical protein
MSELMRRRQHPEDENVEQGLCQMVRHSAGVSAMARSRAI